MGETSEFPQRIMTAIAGGHLRELAQDRVVGGRVYDAHIAEIARLSGARAVVTDNRRHFAGLARHGIRVLGAEEFARSANLTR
jgi:hypothetical protein